MTEIIEMYTS